MVSDIIERVEYSLAVNGTISNWLAHGPDLSPIHNLPDVVPSEGATFGAGRRWVLNYWAYHPESIRLKTRLYQDLKPFDWQPTTQPILDVPFQKGRWNYRAVGEDGVVDFSHFNFSPALMRAWTYAQLTVDTVQSVQAEIQTIGPCQAWLNGACVFTYDETFRYVHPLKLTTTLSLQAGPNDLYLHGLMLGWREARLVLGMRLLDSPAIRVRLPLGDIPVRDWQQAENDLAQIHIKQFAFPQLPITLELSPTAPNPVTMEAEIQTDILGRPWKDTPDLEIPTCVTTLSLAPGETGSIPVPDDMLKAITTLPGEQTLHLILHSDAARQYERQQEVWVTGNRFSHAPYGDYESRRQEALEHLARIPCDVMGTLAAVALGQQEYLDSLAIEIALDFLQRRFDCADFYAVSLLMLLYRYGGSEHLKEADREKITATFRDFKYWIDEPGLDAMCYFTENHQILFHVTALLAGQYWPDSVFTNSGLTGRQQQQRAHRRIQNWILRRLQGGYSEWDSNSYMTLDVFAMLALAEHAQSARLREMATALLHKTFFMLAVQSYRGTHGSTHGRCYVTGLKSARVENSSGIQRIAWGMGIFNGETRATGLLALAQNYRVPSVIQKIGADISRDLVTCAHSSGRLRRHFD
ncbi:MAG: hypothetical protein L0154_08395, partial [Chloroflexi bacterium]|nr:hypothetical protein [Chloroflexota bacterium]